MSRIAVDLFYLPNLEFFSTILDFDEILVDPDQDFRRKSYINRSDILGPNKVQRLTVPIQGRRPRIPEKYLKIDYEQKWVQGHLRSIQSAYGKAPFYEYYAPLFEQIYAKEYQLMWDLNLDLLTLCLRLLSIPAKIVVGEKSLKGECDQDIRGFFNTQEPFTTRNVYQEAPYFQLFGVDFEPNLSILDLIYNVGPESKLILEQSNKKTLNNR